MKLLFLRGQVPTDRDPKEIVFDKLEDCDDVWTQLAYYLLRDSDKGEIWYWGGGRKHRFKPNFLERWLPSFDNDIPNYKPSVIMCRGGFQEYNSIIRRFPKAFVIYYGAGTRFIPRSNADRYDLILQDSPRYRDSFEGETPITAMS